jgi:hypothetical protein
MEGAGLTFSALLAARLWVCDLVSVNHSSCLGKTLWKLYGAVAK